MQKEKIINSRWYRCPDCYNYSFVPARCCDKQMLEVDGDNESHETYRNFVLNETFTQKCLSNSRC